ncbi:MAG: hypothetical protein AAGG06_20225 [Pseudomonadota bacterium]
MTAKKDVEALLSAVRALVAERADAASDPLVLTDAHRIGPSRPSESEGERSGPPARDALLRDFARLTRIIATEGDGASAAVADREGAGLFAQPEQQRVVATEPDMTALRSLVRDILRDELQEDMGRHIADSIQRVLEEELVRRADPAR